MFKSRFSIIAAIAAGIVVINLIIFAAGPFVGANTSAPGFGDLRGFEASQLNPATNSSSPLQGSASNWEFLYRHPLYGGLYDGR
jgi:hypothetical protein